MRGGGERKEDKEEGEEGRKGGSEGRREKYRKGRKGEMVLHHCITHISSYPHTLTPSPYLSNQPHLGLNVLLFASCLLL